LKAGLVACREAGAIGAEDVELEVLAHLLSGALNEAVFLIAESPHRARSTEEAKRALCVFLSGLARRRPRPRRP
jgi:hypothetical protein